MQPLQIGLKVNANDVKSTAEELKQEFKRMSDSVMGKEVTTRFASLQLQMDKTMQKSDELVGKMKALEGQKILTPEYESARNELSKLGEEYNKLLNKQEKYQEQGKTVPTSLVSNITMTRDQIDGLNAELTKMRIKGEGSMYILGENTKEYARYTDQLKNTNNAMAIQAQQFTNLEGTETREISTLEQFKQSLLEVSQDSGIVESALIKMGIGLIDFGQVIKSHGEQALEGFKTAVKTVFKQAIPTAIKGAGKLAKGLLTLGKNALFAQKNLFKLYDTKIGSFFKKGSDGVHDMTKAFKRGLTKVFAYGFGIRSLFRLFNKLRGYAKDALNAMSQQFDDVNKDLSAIVTGFNKLKNSIGTAVQPIVSALTPALVMLENVLSNVLVKIGEFFAVLTGQKYVYKAVDAEIDYAKSLDDSTDATNKNTKATKDNQKQLGYYDKLNVIGQDDNGDKNTTTSDDGAGNLTAQFEKVDPTKAVSEFAKKVRQAWEDADFTEVGNIIGKKLQSALQSIPWDEITTQAERIGKSLGTLINGFVETETGGVSLGSTIGSTLASGINAGVSGITSFLDNTHWDSVGKFLTDGLNTAISEIKWDNLGSMIGKGLTALWTIDSAFWNDTDFKGFGSGVATALKNAISNADFSKLGSSLQGKLLALPNFIIGFLDEIDWDNAWENFKTKVQEFISGIDFVEIFSTLGEMSGKIINALYNVVKDIWADIKAYFDPYIESAGGDIFWGVLMGIVDAINTINQWINENVVQPFIKAFKKGFGIASPSKVMKQIGVYIMQGLISGIKSLWKSLKEFVKGIPSKIKDIFKGLPTFFSNIFKKAFRFIKSAFSGIKTFFKGVWGGIKGVFSNVATWFFNKFDKAFKKIKEVFSFDTAKKVFESVFNGIKEALSDVGSFIKTTFEDAWDGVKEVFTEGGKLFEGIKDGVVECFKGMVNALIKGINAIIKEPFETINGLLNDIRDFKVPVINKKVFKGLWDKDPLPIPKIPKLAQGAVIPPNKEFLAMLGDQKQGTNIEAPLDTIVQAFNQALAQNSTSGTNGDIVVKINSKEIARAVWSENEKKYKQNGAFIPKYS